MTTESIKIRITSEGADRAARDIRGLGAGAKDAAAGLGGVGSALGSLKRIVAGGALLALGREAIRTADAYTELTNRIRVVTRSEREAVAVRSDLFQIANRTRGSVTSLSEVYGRLALTTESLGLSQREVLQLTESLQQATVLSGASAQSASAALIQLSQGLGAGALRGEELNSVLENTPVIAQVIADQLGVNIGQLRKMGAEGKITGRQVVDAFASAREELAQRFGKAVPTVAQAMTVLKNTTVELAGELSTATGLSASLASTITDLANNTGDAIPEIVALTKSLTNLSQFKGLFGDIFGSEEERDDGLSGMRFWAIAIANIEDRFYALAKARDAVFSGGLLTAEGRASLKQALDATNTFGGVGPATQRLMDTFAELDTVKLGARFPSGGGEGPTLPPGHPLLDPLAATGATGSTTPSRATATSKGATVGSELAMLQRRNELLRMSNERRKVEEDLDQIRARIKRQLLPQEEQQIRAMLERNRVQEFLNQSTAEGLRLQQELADQERARMAERGAAAGRRAGEVAAIGARERQRAADSTFGGATELMGAEFLANTRTVGQELAAIFGPGGTLQQGMLGVVGSLSDAIGYSIAFGQSWNDTAKAIENIGRSIIGEILSSLIRIPIQMAINESIASALRAKSTTETVAANTTIAASAAPAAAATSLATAGTNSIPASAAIIGVAALAATALAANALFERGGYTGDGSRKGVAGLVHGQEYVLNADATRRYRGHLDAMNEGRWSPPSGGGGGGVHITIVDQTDGSNQFETRQISASEVEVIVRRVAPQAVADDLGAPHSRVGRALGRDYSTRKVRA